MLAVIIRVAQSGELKAPSWAAPLVAEVCAESYPELRHAVIRVQPLKSTSDYFRARFSFPSFFSAKEMQFILRVNTNTILESVPLEERRAVIAHELAHVLYYTRHRRVQLLRLVALSNNHFREQFEKQADREAVVRGYGRGLKAYRLWLYQNVPAQALAEKKRDYLTPNEIDAIMPLLPATPSGRPVQAPRQ